ncbi:MAG: hypothetical protein LAN83_13015 [Acidobacteriia bacterium]|nr:hypothetical protein [Terriglobia bacterium]
MKRIMLVLASVLLFGMGLWAQTGAPAASPSPAVPGARAEERSESAGSGGGGTTAAGCAGITGGIGRRSRFAALPPVTGFGRAGR